MNDEKKPRQSDSGNEKPEEETPSPESAGAEKTPSPDSSGEEEAPSPESGEKEAASLEPGGEEETPPPESSGTEEAPSPESSGEEEAPSPESSGEEPSGEEPAAPVAAKKRARPTRPPRKKGPVYEKLEEDSLAGVLSEHLEEGVLSAQSFLEQKIYTVDRRQLLETMAFLKDDQDFDYLVDLTALDYLGDEARWCLVYHLYSHSKNTLIRVKSRLEEGEVAPSMSSIWKSANWMERETFDMFGIRFAGHPDLRRILLPEDWHGHPLRKDYDIKLQDQSWISKHLRIRKVPN